MTDPFDDRWDIAEPVHPDYIHVTNGQDSYDNDEIAAYAATAPPGLNPEQLINHIRDAWIGTPLHRDHIQAALDQQANDGLPTPVDWKDLFNREHRGEEWAIPQILPAGRLGTIWAKRKTGKSLLSLDLCAAVASGRPVLGQTPVAALDVVYLDLEMTEDDLEERITDLGYQPDQLDHLHYYLLPSLPPLNDYAGGNALMALVKRHQAQLVVIDTLARVVTGKENDADTIQAFYRCTGIPLKRAGISCLRLDHGGKEHDKLERGSSAKGDDVDLSWELKDAGGDQYVLKKSYSRISWVPEELKLRRETEPLRHVITQDNWPAGTEPCAQHLDRLQVPVDAPIRTAVAALRTADISPRRQAIVAAAQRWRKHPDRLLNTREQPVDNPREQPREQPPNTDPGTAQ